MSKLIKSQSYVQAHPCRLEPIDVDAFFINNQVDENNAPIVTEENPAEGSDSSQELKNEDPAETGIREIASAAERPEDAPPVEIPEENLQKQPVSAPGGFDLRHLANVAEQIGAIIDGAHVENATGAVKDISSILFGSKREMPQNPNVKPETVDFTDAMRQESEALLSKLKKETADLIMEMKPAATPGFLKDKSDEETKREAEKIFFEAKNRALNVKEGGKTPESRVEGAGQTGNGQIENARNQAGSILDGAKQKAGEIAAGAQSRAEKIIAEAKQQAESVIAIAKNTGDEIIQRSGEQAEEIIKTARQQEAEIIKTAKEEGEKLLAAARGQAAAEAVSIKEQASAEGLETGRREGVAQVRAELEKNLTTALSLVAQTEQEMAKFIASSEPEMLKLAVYIAERIIGDEIKLDAKRQIDIMKEALSRVTTATNLLIRLNPDDCELVRENIALLQEAFKEPKPIKLEGDPGIPPGSCFIETDHGNIDARIKSQLDMIMAELLKVGRIE